MNLFRREFKANSKAMIIWTVATIALNYVSYWKYGGTGATEQMNQIFSGFSDVVNTLFGVSPLGVSDVMGYAALIIYYVYFIGLIYALLLGAKILQKELDEHTAEFLFTKPISRIKILNIKSVVAIINMAVFNIFNAIVSIGLMISVNDLVYSDSEITKYIGLSYLGLFILMVMTYAITIVFNTLFANARASIGGGGLFIVYAYASAVIILSFEKLNDLTILSPWRYFSPDVLVNDGFSIIYLIICIVIISICYGCALRAIKSKMF